MERIQAERAAVVADLDVGTVDGIRELLKRELVRVQASKSDELSIAREVVRIATLLLTIRRDHELEAEFEALRSFIESKFPDERERFAASRRVH